MAKQPAKGHKARAKPQKPAVDIADTVESVGPVIDAIPAEVHIKPQVDHPEPVETAAVPPVTKPQAKPDPAPAPTAATRNGRFFPLLLGGLIAGVIGFAVATFTTPSTDTTLADQIVAQTIKINRLEQRLTAMPTVDLSSVETAQAGLRTDLEVLSVSLADVVERITALEDRPAGTGAVSVDATAAVEAEMDALRAQIAEMTGAAQTELEEARAAVAAIEENAAAAARNAAARAALARVQTGLESGAPLGAVLGDLEQATGAAVPDALTAVQEGVPTLASLQEQFPDVARAALATARSEGVAGEGTSGFGAFMRNQFDLRSTTPREGDSADAILSRAEAAVRTGRLSDALAEISALPEVVRAEMSDWLGQAEARANAIAAVDILSTSLSDS